MSTFIVGFILGASVVYLKTEILALIAALWEKIFGNKTPIG